MQRVTIYGWVLQKDPIHGWGSGSLVDLIYFIDENLVSVRDIFDIVERAGYKIISKKIAGTKTPEADRVTVENWNDHLKIGVEKLPEGTTFERSTGTPDRYNYPYSGGM